MTTTSTMVLGVGTSTFNDEERQTEIDRHLLLNTYAFAGLPPALAKIAELIARMSGNRTGDGDTYVKTFSSALITGQALLLKTPLVVLTTAPSIAIQEDTPHLSAVRWMKEATGLPYHRIAELVGVSRQTLNAWERGEPIADTKRQRVLSVRSVLERAAKTHPTRVQLIAWLDTPRGAEGQTPAKLLSMGEIDRARLIALSTPSSKLRPPQRTLQNVPSKLRTRAEGFDVALPPDHDEELFAEFGDLDSDEDN